MRKIKPRHVVTTIIVLTGLAACSTAGAGSPGPTASSPAAATSSASASVTAPATAGSSTVVTGAPPSAASSARAPGQPRSWNSPANAEAFYAQIQEAAVHAMKSTGIPASVLMAIAAQESAYGSTDFATQAHNLFAQPCGHAHDCVGKYLKYKDWSHSIQDFAARVASSPVVKGILQLAPGAVHQIATAIGAIVSASPLFGQNVSDEIARYNLQENDLASQAAA